MQGQSLGSVEFGQVLHFAVSNRSGSDGSDIAGLTPAYFDVVDPSTDSILLADQPLTKITSYDVWTGSVDTGDIPTDQDTDFTAGRTYALVIKGATGSNPSAFMLFSFTVTGAFSARLKRLLSQGGENQLLDSFSYDAAGNCLSYRVRIFEDRDSAEAATPDITDLPEPGEVLSYTCTQSYSSGRQLRASVLTLIDDDQGDE